MADGTFLLKIKIYLSYLSIYLSLVALSCSAGQILAQSLQSLTAHNRQFLQGNLFLLAVCTHEVPLYLHVLHLL